MGLPNLKEFNFHKNVDHFQSILLVVNSCFNYNVAKYQLDIGAVVNAVSGLQH